jgi:hypothetical protein
MTSRQYSSFLLRFWWVNETEAGKDFSNPCNNPMVLQLQHMQTGTTWRLHSLEELNEFLGQTLKQSANASDFEISRPENYSFQLSLVDGEE